MPEPLRDGRARGTDAGLAVQTGFVPDRLGQFQVRRSGVNVGAIPAFALDHLHATKSVACGLDSPLGVLIRRLVFLFATFVPFVLGPAVMLGRLFDFGDGPQVSPRPSNLN